MLIKLSFHLLFFFYLIKISIHNWAVTLLILGFSQRERLSYVLPENPSYYGKIHIRNNVGIGTLLQNYINIVRTLKL